MEMLVTNGFSVPVALRESVQCVSNRAYRDALIRSCDLLEKGVKLSTSLLEAKELPRYIGIWVAVAEETGSVASVFTQIRSYFQANYDDLSGRVITLLEPLMILIVGTIIMILVVQFVLPIFAIYGKVM
jgi:type II secretory pathway component PulF